MDNVELYCCYNKGNNNILLLILNIYSLSQMQDFCKGLYRHFILETMLGTGYSFSLLCEQKNNLIVKGGGGGLVAKSCPILVTPWTITLQAPLSLGFPSQNTGVDCQVLLHRIFLTQGSNPDLLHCRQSPAQQADSLPIEPPRKPIFHYRLLQIQNILPCAHCIFVIYPLYLDVYSPCYRNFRPLRERRVKRAPTSLCNMSLIPACLSHEASQVAQW